MKERILILEDEPSIADTLTYALQSEGFETLTVQTVQEAQVHLPGDWALAIFDVGLPDGSGFELLKSLRKSSTLPVILLTARSSELDKVVGLEIGADDYVVKPFSPREVVARVRTVLRRTKKRDAPVTSESGLVHGSITLNEAKLQVSVDGRPVELSRYEFRILRILMSAPGRVYSREQLMSLAWEEPEMSLERTVDAHIKSLRGKLKAAGASSDPIATHRGFGYAFREDFE